MMDYSELFALCSFTVMMASFVHNWRTHLHSFLLNPSISDKELIEALNFAKEFINIIHKPAEIILHCRKSILFQGNEKKQKQNDGEFDATQARFMVQR